MGLEAVGPGRVGAVVIHRDRQEVILQIRVLDPLAAADEDAGLELVAGAAPDRKSVGKGKSASVRVDLGGSRILTNQHRSTTPKIRLNEAHTTKSREEPYNQCLT